MSAEPPFLPRAALRLGFLGLAPLAVSALVSLSAHASTARLGAISFSLYAAVLLSFLGGVRCGIEIMRALFDHPQAEVNVPEQAALLGLSERRSASELPHATEIVKQRGCEKKIGAQARMELGGLTAESRYSHGVLEKTSGVKAFGMTRPRMPATEEKYSSDSSVSTVT